MYKKPIKWHRDEINNFSLDPWKEEILSLKKDIEILRERVESIEQKEEKIISSPYYLYPEYRTQNNKVEMGEEILVKVEIPALVEDKDVIIYPFGQKEIIKEYPRKKITAVFDHQEINGTFFFCEKEQRYKVIFDHRDLENFDYPLIVEFTIDT